MTFVIGLMVMAVIVLLLVLISYLYARSEKNRRQRREQALIIGKNEDFLDERQRMEHSNAGEFAGCVAVLYYLALYIILDYWRINDMEPLVEPSLLVIFGIMLISVSYCFYCLMTDVVIPFVHDRTSTSAVLYFFGGWSLLSAVLSAADGEIHLTGTDSDAWFRLIEAVFCICIASVYLIAHYRDKRKAYE